MATQRQIDELRMMRPNQTSHETMERLWRELVETFMEYLDSTPRSERRADMLGEIRKFLKDNDVACNAAHKVDTRAQLSSLLTLGVPFGNTEKDH